MSARKTPVWITRDGREIPVKEMESEHLKNTIYFLRRRYRLPLLEISSMRALSAWAYAATAPDGAAMAAEQWANDEISQEGLDRTLAKAKPIFGELLREAAKRKLLDDRRETAF